MAAQFDTDSGQVLAPETLFTMPPGYLVNAGWNFYDVASDDQRFLMVRPYVGEGDESATELILVQNFFEVLKERVGGVTMSQDPTARLNAALEGRYKIERMLGEGGMATVYLAEDLKHDRKVALKVLKPELGAIVGAERFLGEIKVTANLQHPHILPLFDSGEADKLLFYVMPREGGRRDSAELRPSAGAASSCIARQASRRGSRPPEGSPAVPGSASRSQLQSLERHAIDLVPGIECGEEPIVRPELEEVLVERTLGVADLARCVHAECVLSQSRVSTKIRNDAPEVWLSPPPVLPTV